MSEVQRPQKLSSDFSIARILADEHIASSGSICNSTSVPEYLKINEGSSAGVKRNLQTVTVDKPVSSNRREDLDHHLQPLSVPNYSGVRYLFNGPQGDHDHIRRVRVTECQESSESSSVFGLKQDRLPESVEKTKLEWLQCASSTQDPGHTQPFRVSEFPEVSETSYASDSKQDRVPESTESELTWLRCTRYKPPRLPRRSSAGRTTKRRPGKHPRIPFTAFQLQVLEDKYRLDPYLARRDVIQLSSLLRLPQSRVKIWFQNRRARDRRESLLPDTISTVLNINGSQRQQTQVIENGQSVKQSATRCIERVLSSPNRDQPTPGSS